METSDKAEFALQGHPAISSLRDGDREIPRFNQKNQMVSIHVNPY